MEKFLEFQRQLQNEILRLEFNRKSHGLANVICEKEFAELLIAYAGFPPKKKSKMLKRVRKAFSDEQSVGITLDDFLNFYQVLHEDFSQSSPKMQKHYFASFDFFENIKQGGIIVPKTMFYSQFCIERFFFHK